jgi:hypothetical protein
VTYPPANVWWQVQINPKPEPEPELVRANPNLLPALYVPAEWSEERIKAFRHAWLQKWPQFVHISQPLTNLTIGQS